jgi:hypothetical protein
LLPVGDPALCLAALLSMAAGLGKATPVHEPLACAA